MAIKKILGAEIEYGVTVRNQADFDPISTSLLLVNSYPSSLHKRILWDYDFENPLMDARGFEVEGGRESPSEEENRSINRVLYNGARYYVDHAHPEYSTPECTDARELVMYEKAGDRILDASRQKAEELLGPERRILIYKNNSDRKGNSYGHHENYLMDRRIPFKQISSQLMPFVVTRQTFCGGGKVGAENQGAPVEYQLSQRADFFEMEIGLDTMGSRPIINTRDEPHADKEKYRRLHVIVGDSNMSEVSTYLKVGTTAVVLEMIEDNYLYKDLTLRNPVQAIKDVSRDVTCREKVALEDGRKLTAVEVQKEYLELALKYYAERGGGDEVTADVLRKWEYVLGKLEEEPLELDREVDWVIKRKLLEAYRAKHGLRWDDHRILMMDLQYHDLRPDKGLYYLLERQGKVERVVTDEEIRHATEHPPTGTRAYFRGACLRKFGPEVFGVNWDSISFCIGNQPIKRVLMAEPARGSKFHVGELIERSETVEALIANLAS